MTGERESLNLNSQGTLSKARGEKSFSPALDAGLREEEGPELEVTVVHIKQPSPQHGAHWERGPQ